MGPTEPIEPTDEKQKPIIAADPEQAAFDTARDMYRDQPQHTAENPLKYDIEDARKPVKFEYKGNVVGALPTGEYEDEFGNRIFQIFSTNKTLRLDPDFPTEISEQEIKGLPRFSAENPKPVETELRAEDREKTIDAIEDTSIQNFAQEAAKEKPSEWSEQAAIERREATLPTRDDPFMFEFGDRVSKINFTIGEHEVSGYIDGYFYEGGKRVELVNLNTPSREVTRIDDGFVELREGQIQLPSEKSSRVEAPVIPDLQEAMNGIEDEPTTPEGIVARLPEVKRARDKIELESYAAADKGLMNNPDDPTYTMVKHQNWGRMSDAAKAVAGKYSHMVNVG